jgi:hypothetical protein
MEGEVRWSGGVGGQSAEDAEGREHGRAILAAWHSDYNHVRPHSGLGGAMPIEVTTRVSPQPGPGHAPVAINARAGHYMRGPHSERGKLEEQVKPAPV